MGKTTSFSPWKVSCDRVVLLSLQVFVLFCVRISLVMPSKSESCSPGRRQPTVLSRSRSWWQSLSVSRSTAPPLPRPTVLSGTGERRGLGSVVECDQGSDRFVGHANRSVCNVGRTATRCCKSNALFSAAVGSLTCARTCHWRFVLCYFIFKGLDMESDSTYFPKVEEFPFTVGEV